MKKILRRLKSSFLIPLKLATVILSLSMGSVAFGQLVNTYGFSAFSGTYSPLVSPTQSSVALTADGAMTTNIDIGFSFVFNGNTYTQLRASSDGFVVFGTTGTTTLTNNLATTTANKRPGLAPLWDDLQCTSGITYQTNGVAPNRTFTLEWKDMEWNWQSTTAVMSFQVVLYESTNIVDFIYQQGATAVNNGSASIGIMGTATTDYISLQDVTASPVISTTSSLNTLNVKPATNQVYRFTPSNPATPDIFQTATVPNCLNGAEVDLTGTPPANVTWYWQTSATGTSTADPYTGPKFYPINGYVYANSFNSLVGAWSFTVDSFEITNVPTATTPPNPIASQNPACVTDGSSLSMPAAPGGTVYYWQGTDNLSLSTSNDAVNPYAVSTSGTYYVRAFETATSCWSDAASIAVTINTIIPSAPIVPVSELFECTGASSIQAEAQDGQIPGSLTTSLAPNNGCGGGAMFDVSSTTNSITFTGFEVIPAATSVQDLNVYVRVGSYLGNETNMGAWTLIGTYNFSGTINVPILIDADDFTIPPGQVTGIYLNANIRYVTGTNSYSNSDLQLDAGAGLCSAFGGVNAGRSYCGVVHYLAGVNGDINWYDAASSGNLLGTGTPFEVVGTSVLPTATTGEYIVYAGANYLGCNSASTTPVTINVNPVNVILNAIDVNCNNGENGSFAISTVECGTVPYSYSVDGGAFGPAPTNLAPGTYSVVVQDGASNQSAAYTIEVMDAPAPTDAVIDSYNNDQVVVSWTAGAFETQWNVEWGLPGFVPGTGTSLGTDVALTNSFTINGLDGNTDYEIYISANCGATTLTGDWIMANVTTLCDPYMVPFAETFEDDSDTRDCWMNIQEVGAANWTYMTGSSGGVVNTAYEGTLNARFVSSSGTATPITKLASPILLAPDQDSVAVIFAYAQEVWAGDQNITRVFSRGSSTQPWNQEAEYTQSVNAWTVDTLFVQVTTDTIEIAFEGENNFGRANVVDHVQVYPCSVAPGVDGNMDVCRLEGTIDLNTVATPGQMFGEWSFPQNETFLNGSILDVSLLPDGTYNFYYIIKTPCLDDTTVATISVSSQSSAGINGVLTTCMNQPINLVGGLNGNVDLGGVWTGPTGTVIPNGYFTTGQLPGQFNYTYVTSNGVCPNDTSEVLVNVQPCDWLSIDELAFEGITVYPNPSTGVFYISNEENGQDFTFEVLDLNGKVLVDTKSVIGSSKTELDLTSVQDGVYMIRLTSETGQKMIRIVKN